MRALVTGGHGFVGRYLCAALQRRGDDVVVADRIGEDAIPLDLSDPENLRGVVELARPDTIFHLAAQAFVPDAIADPLAAFDVNARGTALFIDAIRSVRARGEIDPRIVIVSSADVYGDRPAQDYPLRETHEPRPANPYAASKVAAEAIALAFHRAYGLDVVVTRAFNHVGPGQSDRFVVASFAMQLARIAHGAEAVIRVGNLTAKRDFLDVRDVVSAYLAVADRAPAGEIYNVGSGRPIAIREMLRLFIEAAHLPVEVREDPERFRPVDVPVAYGDMTKIREATGWEPSIPLGVTVRETYRAALAALDA